MSGYYFCFNTVDDERVVAFSQDPYRLVIPDHFEASEFAEIQNIFNSIMDEDDWGEFSEGIFEFDSRYETQLRQAFLNAGMDQIVVAF